MNLNWQQINNWRWALVDLDTDTSVSTVLNAQGVWERHGHEYSSLAKAKAAVEVYAQSCLVRHGKLPDKSHQ